MEIYNTAYPGLQFFRLHPDLKEYAEKRKACPPLPLNQRTGKHCTFYDLNPTVFRNLLRSTGKNRHLDNLQ